MAEFSEHDPRIADAIQRLRVENQTFLRDRHDGELGDLVVTVARALGVTTTPPQAEPTTGYSIGTSAAGLTATPVGDPWSDPVIAAQIDAPAAEVRAHADRLTRQAHALRAIAAYLDTRDPATRAADQLEVAALNGEVRIARARDIARDLRAAVADATGDAP